MLTNPRDAFLSQAASKNAVNLKPGLGVTQGRPKWHQSIDRRWLPIHVL